jgi:hypothetical protein
MLGVMFGFSLPKGILCECENQTAEVNKEVEKVA